MSRTQRFMSGFVSGYAHLLAATVAGLWLTPFFLGHLGQATYGLWLVGTQVLAYLLLMDFGIVALLPREAAYVTGRTGARDGAELRPLVEKALTLAVAQTPFVLLAAAGSVFWLQGSWSGLRLPLAFVLGLFVLTFPLRVFGATLTGLQDLAFVARAQLCAWAAGTAVNVLLVLQGYGLTALAAGWCVTQALVIGSCVARVAMLFPAAMPRRLRIQESLAARDYVMRSLWVSVSQVSQVLLNGTDLMIIGALLGPAAVVPYACTGKLVSVLANQPQAILQSAAPALSELRTAASRDRLFQVSAALAQATLAVSGLVACVVLAVNGGFVTWWVGADQFGGLALTVLLLAAMMIRHFNTTNVYALFCFGFERRLALTGLADGIVTLGISYALVRAVGVAGAPVGALAGVLLVSGPLNSAALSRETGVAPAQMLAALGPWLWRLVLVVGIAGIAGYLVRPPSFVLLALMGGAAGLLYTLAIVAPLMRSPAGVYLQPLAVRIARVVPISMFRGGDQQATVPR
jgi:O-antigen/teichoic acid export membrane protein